MNTTKTSTPILTSIPTPEVSIIIPVYNEEKSLDQLFARIYPALDNLKNLKNLKNQKSYELIFVNDGSKDRSEILLHQQFLKRRDVTKVILLHGNYGQHMAIMAGFKHSRGKTVVTLDADLQNPPEEIQNLLDKIDEGFDYVGSIRSKRQDYFWRKISSRLMNTLRKQITSINITDQGCMLRAYSRHIIEAINQCNEINTFIPALAYTFAKNPTEIIVKHEQRLLGESKYSFYKLVRLNFDLMTAFSVAPIQLFSILGMLIAVGSGAFFVFLTIRRFIVGPEVEGVFTLFAILFFLVGVSLFGIGLLGEYIGRIYQVAKGRPRYLIDKILEENTPKQIKAKAETKTKAVVFGYHNVGVRCLKVLLESDYKSQLEVSLLVTHKDNPNENIWFESIAKVAKENNIPIIYPDDPNSTTEVIEQIKKINPDYIFSFYYRNMLSAEILNLVPTGKAFNMHGSLLPKYRGRVPVNWAVIRGEKETGATLHVMNEKPDNGPIVDQQAVPILENDSAFEVFNKVTLAAEITLQRALPQILNGSAKFTTQNFKEGGYFKGRRAEDGEINFSKSSAREIHNLVRGVTRPYPGAFAFIRGKKVIKMIIWKTKIETNSNNYNFDNCEFDAPTMFINNNNGQVYLKCIDNQILSILDFEIDNQLDNQHFDFIKVFGNNSIPLVSQI
ncbi:MAG: formyltransferase [Oligoflexia bacterium]|nr:formyltransferase [Oligoflexia bacterium]